MTISKNSIRKFLNTSRQGHIIRDFWNKGKLRSLRCKEPLEQEKKYFLSLHTVFILEHNIDFLEEFIVYYLHIGFEHFYLYDNEGTAYNDFSSTGTYVDGKPKKDKFGYKFSVYNSPENEAKLNRIIKKYPGKITVVKWQPKDENGKIIFALNKAIEHFIATYGKDNTWTAFMDIDEFLFSPSGLNIVALLKAKQQRNFSRIRMVQKKFVHRKLTQGQYVTQDFRCVDFKVGLDWAAKCILRCDDFIIGQSPLNIHDIKVSNRTYFPKEKQLRFNHYNTNELQLAWMEEYYNKPFSLDAVDDSFKRYRFLFDDKKGNK